MASPFRVFRKHQKTLLVVAGVVLMFVFVLGDSLSAILRRLGGPGVQRGSTGARAVAVRWKDGKLTNAELGMLVMRRRIVNDFLRGVELTGRMAVIDSGAEPQPLRVQMLVGPELPQQGVEQSVVQMKLFAEAARRAGMTISDENIRHYLQELGRGRVSGDQLRAMLAQMRSAGRGASIDYIFEGLREEMLARNYLAGYAYALATITPEQRWQDWLRANDRVVVETAALPVAPFMVDVPEPTDAELAEFFVTKDPRGVPYNEREPQPDIQTNTELPSPLPAFAIPRKIDVRYVRADYNQMLTKLEGEVTDKEIQDFYDANKQLFIRADSGLTEAGAAGGGGHLPRQVASGAAGAPSTPAEMPTAPGTEPSAQSEPSANAEPSGAAPAPAAAKPSGDDGTSPAPATGDSSQLDRPSRPSPFRLTALEQNADDASAAPTDQGNAPTSGDAQPKSSPTATPSAGTPATEAPAAEAPSTGAASAEGPPPATSGSSTEAQPGGAAPSEQPPVQYQPLDEVRDQIRRELASQKVSEHLIKLMDDLKSRLGAAFSTYFGAVLDAKAAGKEPPAPPPELADLSALAKEKGLDYGETGPVSILKLRDLSLGKSVDAETSEPLLQMMFGNEVELYQPVTTFDVDNNRYLAIKVSDTPRRVPELSEVRDEVVRAWKLQKAADLAQKHAEELAAKIQQAGVTLADYFADDSSVYVQRTDPFAWLTIGDVPQIGTFRLSEPSGVVAAGPDFMRTVFGLGDNQVGAVLNHDHSVSYIVRVATHLDTPEQLRKAYLDEADQWYGLATMNQRHSQDALAALGSSFREAASVDWLRPPDQIARQDQED